MKIERIDDKTIKCFISNEELEEYEISYKDFVLRNDKAREVIEDIMEQAGEEVNYKPPTLAFEMQIMVLPEQGMILTFSEKNPEEFKQGKEFMQCMKELKGFLEHEFKDMGGSPEKQEQMREEVKAEYDGIFVFREMHQVMELAAVLPAGGMKSILYKMEDRYYLHLGMGDAPYDDFSKACIRALEFGELYGAGPERADYIREHAECLIEQDVLGRLRGEL